MAIAIRGTTPATAFQNGAGTVSVTLTGARQPQNTDLLVIAHLNNFFDLSNMNTPTVGGSSSGVTLQGTADAGTNQGHTKLYTYAVGATGDLTVSVTETGTGDEERGLAVWVLSGADTASPIDGSASTGFDTATGTSRVMPAITTTNTDSYLLAAIGHGPTAGGTAYTPPGGSWVEDYEVNIVGNNYMTTGGHEQLSASGPTGTRTFTLTGGSAEWSGVMVAIKTAGSSPAVAPPVISSRPGKTWKRRFKHLQRLALDSTVTAALDVDPTQAGYSLRHVWYRPPAVPQQRIPYESPPGLLDTAQLENELLGSGSTWEQYNRAATHVDRRQVPQYTLRESAYGLLDQAQLEVPPPLPITYSEAATHKDRRLVPQQPLRESVPGLLDTAQLEVLPPLPWWYDSVAYWRPPWLRIKQAQVDQSSQPDGTAFDPIQAGYSLRHVWRRDPIPPQQRAGIQNPDDVMVVGTGASLAWWGVDDTAHHFNHWLPTQSDPSFYTPPVLADPTQAGYGPRWMWYRAPAIPQQRELESVYGLLDQALLEVPPPLSIAYELAATHQRLPWLRIKQQQYDQSAPLVVTDFDPTQGGGYGPQWRWWYRLPAIPQQRIPFESPYGLLDSALLENELLGGVDDLTRHRGWFARPWFGLQMSRKADQSTPPAPDADPTQAGYGPRWVWYRPPVAPQQRPLESDPRLLLTAQLENELLGGWDDILRHRTWYTDRREVPQQRSYPDALQPLADPLLVGGAEWRYKLIPVTHKARWVLRQWWQQKTFQGLPPLLFEGTIVGGILGGPGSTGGTLGGYVVGSSRDGYVTGGRR